MKSFTSEKEEYLFEEWLYYAAKKKYPKDYGRVTHFYMWDLRRPEEAIAKKSPHIKIGLALLERFRSQGNYEHLMKSPLAVPDVGRACY